MSHYAWIQLLHLLMAIAFAGMVFVEVVILGGLRGVEKSAMRAVETAIGNRAVRIMPLVILLLFASGLIMAWSHRAALLTPSSSHFGLLLSIKILAAFAILGHFFLAMFWRRKGQLNGRRSRRIHYSVFALVLVVVALAKGMFFL